MPAMQIPMSLELRLFKQLWAASPVWVGDVLGGIQNRLAEHGLVSSKPSLARQIAMRETAKVSMCRLHFSRGLRKAELARSRSTTIEEAPAPGTVCYFYRPVRYNRKGAGSRKKLTLKRWHGPALLVALEGHASAFLSYKGQLTKCALEHVRVASTMEQIAAEASLAGGFGRACISLLVLQRPTDQMCVGACQGRFDNGANCG